MNIPLISGNQIQELIDYSELISLLKVAFASGDIKVPLRNHYHLSDEDILLTMPAWEKDGPTGIKLVTVVPENPSRGIPSINGLYIHFGSDTRVPLCILDAKALTNKRTAAASALASSFLSREDSKKLLFLGTGALAPDLIRAHCSVRSFETVYIWGRNFQKAYLIANQFSTEKITVKPIVDLDDIIPQVDIISAATMAKEPLIKGELVSEGTHIDLVGSYKPDMREADDNLILKSEIYVDTIEGATKESGDIVIPLSKGIINAADIKGELATLCNGSVNGRNSTDEITFFKSVGYALEDLVAGEYFYQKWLTENE
ncbi:MAG: ornithine cyclodeaminase family protein [Saprospiraceae bacterium]|nr:ornithine cyclodeaminase family protein [Saprospiraceae bacterium]